MSAGTLDQRVELRRRDHGTASSGSGAVVEEWPLVARVSAAIRPLSGAEGVAGAGRLAETSYSIRVRWREGLDTTWRVVWRGRALDVTSVVPAGLRLREWLDLTAVDSPATNPVT